jgi:NitT/TauT family transport system ATP-binding protein
MNLATTLIRAEAAIPFFSGNRALSPLTCQIATGSLVCFLGQKFSILNIYLQMLAGLTHPQAGSVKCFIRSQDTVHPDFPSIAYLSYDSSLLSILNGIENVKVPALYHQLGTKLQIEQQANDLLGELQYDADHTVLPAFMSMLQKRHLLIARALMLQPKMLFIENPFAGLELEEAAILGEYLATLVKNKNISLIVSNANLDFVEHYAKQIIYVTEQDFHFFNQWQSFSDYKQLNRLKF